MLKASNPSCFVRLRMLIKLARGFVYTNLWVALAVACLSAVSFYTLSGWNWAYIMLCFSSTVAFYGYARLVESVEREIEPEQSIAEWTLHHKSLITLFTIISAGASIYFWFELPIIAKWGFAISTALSGLYTLPKMFNKRGVRYMAGFKLIYIAAIWTLVTLTIPALIIGTKWDIELILHHIERFAFIAAITIPFDIRDAKTDTSDLLTLPMWIGIKKARNVALGGIAFAILIQFFPGFNPQGPPWPEMLAYAISGWLIFKSDENRPDMYFSFVIEGLPILLAIASAFWFGASTFSV